MADIAYKSLKKGQLLYIEGKVRTRSLLDNDVIKKYITEIFADQFRLLDGSIDVTTITNSESITINSEKV